LPGTDRAAEDWIIERIDSLQRLIAQSDYRGHDPFDLVNSAFASALPPSWTLAQLAISKAGARLAPDRLRALLRVPPIEDPKLYCCMNLGYTLRGEVEADARAREMLNRLAALAGTSAQGAHWGYDFLWPTRTSGTNPRRASTLVPGAFSMLTLIDAILAGRGDDHRELLRASLHHYATRHLCRDASGQPFLGYFEGISTNTHNANLLGCAALTLGALLFDDQQLARVAAQAAGTTMARVEDSGYLEYADHRSAQWCDGFHHLYVIASLRVIGWGNPFADQALCADVVGRLSAYWEANFLRDDGLVNYFPGRLHPIDPHNYAATAIYAVCFGGDEGPRFARDVLRRVDELAWDPRRGAYAHRVHGRRTDSRLFLRWTQAWMFAALCAVARPDRLRARRGAYEALRTNSALTASVHR